MTAKRADFFSQVKQLGVITSIPLILLIGPAVGYWIGSWIDRKFHIYPWFTIIWVGLGFIGSGREVMRLLKNVLKDDQKQSKS